jgi:hypothetical protein
VHQVGHLPVHQPRRWYVPLMNRGLISLIIGILVIVILVLVIMRLS